MRPKEYPCLCYRLLNPEGIYYAGLQVGLRSPHSDLHHSIPQQRPFNPEMDKAFDRPPKLIHFNIAYQDPSFRWKIPKSITMDRYFKCRDQKCKDKRKKSYQRWNSIARLEQQDIELGMTFDGSEEKKDGVPPPSAPTGIRGNIGLITELRNEIDDIWKNNTAQVYELVSVVIRNTGKLQDWI